MMSKKKASANDTMATTEVLIDRYNRSLSLSSGMSDNEMRQLIADFDNRYLNNSEKREMKELDENMEAQIEKSRKYSGRMIVNSASIALGGPIGAPINAIKMISNSHQYYKSEDERINNADRQREIREKALERYDNRYMRSKELTRDIDTKESAYQMSL